MADEKDSQKSSLYSLEDIFDKYEANEASQQVQEVNSKITNAKSTAANPSTTTSGWKSGFLNPAKKSTTAKARNAIVTMTEPRLSQAKPRESADSSPITMPAASDPNSSSKVGFVQQESIPVSHAEIPKKVEPKKAFTGSIVERFS